MSPAGRRRRPAAAVLGAAALLLAACGGQDEEAAARIVVDDAMPRTWTDGLALALVYDTSGSMREAVPVVGAGAAPKYVVANRAFESVVRRLEQWVASAELGEPRRLETGLVVFDGEGAREAVAFGAFRPQVLRAWVKEFSSPDGSTPLGTALRTAGLAVLRSPLLHKHVLVVTDGESNRGPPPALVAREIRSAADRLGTTVSVHFVAFDVAAAVFAPVKGEGATVVPAADEAELAERLSRILEEEILLER